MKSLIHDIFYIFWKFLHPEVIIVKGINPTLLITAVTLKNAVRHFVVQNNIFKKQML